MRLVLQNSGQAPEDIKSTEIQFHLYVKHKKIINKQAKQKQTHKYREQVDCCQTDGEGGS